MTSPLHVLVVGATGGTGRATVEALLAAGHRVTAFARRAHELDLEAAPDRLVLVDGDATDPAAVDRAVREKDAVVVTLGIRENPLVVRLFGARRTQDAVRSRGTAQVLEAMRRHGVRRLVVCSAFGVGATRRRLRLVDRLFFALLLRPQIADTERQEELVRASDLDWVLARPVHLSDADVDEEPVASTQDRVGAWTVARRSVARFLAGAVAEDEFSRTPVALSGRGAA